MSMTATHTNTGYAPLTNQSATSPSDDSCISVMNSVRFASSANAGVDREQHDAEAEHHAARQEQQRQHQQERDAVDVEDDEHERVQQDRDDRARG